MSAILQRIKNQGSLGWARKSEEKLDQKEVNEPDEIKEDKKRSKSCERERSNSAGKSPRRLTIDEDQNDWIISKEDGSKVEKGEKEKREKKKKKDKEKEEEEQKIEDDNEEVEDGDEMKTDGEKKKEKRVEKKGVEKGVDKKKHVKKKSKKESREEAYILWFEEISNDDVDLVGGKGASLGEMYRELSSKGITVPDGFACTSASYRYFIEKAGIGPKIKELLVDTSDGKKLKRAGKAVRDLILQSEFPDDLCKALVDSYKKMEEKYGNNVDVAVRSSATAEDLPDASFAGQQESYLNIRGREALLEACKKCVASLFTDRAINYRTEKGFNHSEVYLSIIVQKMVRSDKGSSGVMFTVDTETGFKDIVLISASWGLGENVVQGNVNPDEYLVFKGTLNQEVKGSEVKMKYTEDDEDGGSNVKKGKKKGKKVMDKIIKIKGKEPEQTDKKEEKPCYRPVIGKTLGSKEVMMIYSGEEKTKNIDTKKGLRNMFCLNDTEILQLARWGVIIEQHYSEKAGRYCPQDIEWAKDGNSNEIFIVQSRPETVSGKRDPTKWTTYHRKIKDGKELVRGASVGRKIAHGKAKVLNSVKEMSQFSKGDILVTSMTDPDWEPILKMASAVITDRGGRTCHAAIVSRELGVPCIVGTGTGTEILKTGQSVTIDCSEEDGIVWDGKLDFETQEHDLRKLPTLKTKIGIILANPQQAFELSFLPCAGVGLVRMEFVVNNWIQAHPMALLNIDQLDKKDAKKIQVLTAGYKDGKTFFIEKLAQGIGQIAAAFYPRRVILRFSDFKTNEYANLLGGKRWEPEEDNPMLGWRGASRYYDKRFKDAFELECEAVKKIRGKFGLTNLDVMIPMIRTVEEAKKVIEVMEEFGLKRGEDNEHGMKIYGMCEIPCNVILADSFLDVLDGFSIGSNDLTQLTLGVDRDSERVSKVFDERNPAVKALIAKAIEVCKDRGKYCGICGQGPSDHEDFAKWLVKKGIESISLTPDSLVHTWYVLEKAERSQGGSSMIQMEGEKGWSLKSEKKRSVKGLRKSKEGEGKKKGKGQKSSEDRAKEAIEDQKNDNDEHLNSNDDQMKEKKSEEEKKEEEKEDEKDDIKNKEKKKEKEKEEEKGDIKNKEKKKEKEKEENEEKEEKEDKMEDVKDKEKKEKEKIEHDAAVENVGFRLEKTAAK